MIQTLEWTDQGVRFIDQTKLPTEETYVTCKSTSRLPMPSERWWCAERQRSAWRQRWGLRWACKNSKAETVADLKRDLDQICDVIGKTRPTAVNLFWAIRRMQEKFERMRIRPIAQIKQELVEEAKRMHAEDIAANQAMGRHGATLMPSEGGVLTHCNAGALATAGYGTALGVIRAAVEQGKKIHVYADETRPFLQGSRLTAWELMKDGIPTTVISDNMAGRDDEAGQDWSYRGRRRPHRGQRRCRQQDRNVYGRGSGQRKRHPVLRGGADFDCRSGLSRRRPDSHRAAEPKEVTHIAGKQMTPDGVSIENPGVRRDSSEVCHRDHH